MYKLNPVEIKIIEKIAKNTAINYVKKHKYIVMECQCDVYDNIELFGIENDICDFEDEYEFEKGSNKSCNIFKENFSASNIENILSNEYLHKSVEVLTFKEKLVLFSLYIEDKKTKEVADLLNVSVNTIRVLKHRAIKKILKNYINLKGE